MKGFILPCWIWKNSENQKKHPDNSAGDLFGMVKCPFQRLSDLQLGDDRVTLNDLDLM